MIFDHQTLTALLQVILIDIVLAGDNAIVVGMAAAGLPARQRARAIMLGVAFAAVLRILFALVTTHLMAIVGLTFAGGSAARLHCLETLAGDANGTYERVGSTGAGGAEIAVAAAGQIILADISMSLDNVLAVAGAAREHPGVLVIGLVLSVALMGLAAGYVARLLDRFHWLAYAGIGLIAYVAVSMMVDGVAEVGVVAARMF